MEKNGRREPIESKGLQPVVETLPKIRFREKTKMRGQFSEWDSRLQPFMLAFEKSYKS